MAGTAVSAGDRRELPPVQCHVCGEQLGAEWVYLSARALAGRLYALDLCGVCWPMLKALIQLEADGYVPHWQAGTKKVGEVLAPRRRRVSRKAQE